MFFSIFSKYFFFLNIAICKEETSKVRNFLINNFLLLIGLIFQFHDFLVLIKLNLKVTINYMYQVSHYLESISLTKKI